MASDPDRQGVETESERQFRLVDQSLTMHAALHERFRQRDLLLSCALICLSGVLSALTFVGPDRLRAWGLDPSRAPDVIGWLAVALFIASVIGLRVAWAARAQDHRRAVERLFQLKSAFREARSRPAGRVESFAELSAEYTRVMGELPMIPERDFNPLKARHLFKVELSRRISQYPKVLPWLLALQLRLEGVASLRRKRT